MSAPGVLARLERHRRPVGTALAAVAVVVAVVWLLVLPDVPAGAGPLREALLRFGHSVVWALLAVTALLWALGASRRAVERTALAALVVYAAFVAAVVL